METMRPRESDRVLDLGATALPAPDENFFELHYPYKHRIVAAGTEDHTRLPLLHWLPAPAVRAFMGMLRIEFYAREENLNLLSAADLRTLLPGGVDASIRYNRFWGLPSNIMLVIEKAADTQREDPPQRGLEATRT